MTTWQVVFTLAGLLLAMTSVVGLVVLAYRLIIQVIRLVKEFPFVGTMGAEVQILGGYAMQAAIWLTTSLVSIQMMQISQGFINH